MAFFGISRLLPWLVSRILDSRLRFESKQCGKVVVGRDVTGLKHVAFAAKNAVGHGAFFTGEIKVGYATTIGANCYIQGPVTIGNYCQVGPAVGIYGRDHPTHLLTTYFNRNLFQGRLKQHERVAEAIIGHDVWLGHGAIILKGIQVGTGAVIGAGSVVPKNVPEYAIAAGNPARVIKMRFDDDLIRRLLQSRWWLKSVSELEPFEELFHLDLVAQRDCAIKLLNNIAEANHVSQEGIS